MTESRDPAEPDLLNDIVDVARRLSQPFDLRDVLEQIVDTGSEMLRADRASVLLFDPERHELYAEASSAREAEIRFAADTGIAGETLGRRQVINIADCYADPRFNPEIDRKMGYLTRSMISVPLVGVQDEPVGVMQLLNAERGYFDADDDRLARMFASLAALAIQRAQAFEDRLRKVKLELDLSIARNVQMNLLPSVVPELPGYNLATYFRPAEETGGDIYDLIPLRDDEPGAPLMILLADATGHGIGAAVSVTQVRAMLRIASRLGAELGDSCVHMNRQLIDDLPDSRFVTAFLGVLDPRDHALAYYSLGQAPLLHVRGGGRELHWLAASSFPMGMLEMPALEAPPPIRFEPGDIFVLLSDGFYEYVDPRDEEMGRERIGQVILRHREAGAAEMVEALLMAVERFARGAPQTDDLTAVIVKRQER